MKLALSSVLLATVACGGSSKPIGEPDLTPEPITMKLTGVVTDDTDGAANVAFTLAMDEVDTYDCGALTIFDGSLHAGATNVYEPWETAVPEEPLPDGE